MKHFDPKKSYRTFDGAIVTGVERVYAGWTAKGTDGSIYHWYDSAPGSWPTEIKPTFEAGKSYRTRGGDKATITIVGEPNGFLIGRIDGVTHRWSWLLSGRINPDNPDSPYDLLPGAIEDGPKAAEMNTYSPEQYERLVEAAVERERMSDLRQIHSRLNRQAEKLETIRNVSFDEWAKLTSRIEAMQARIDQADRTSQRVGIDLAQRINDTNKRIDAINRKSEVSAAVERLTRLPTDEEIAARGPSDPTKAYKPTIKGGWVNVYWNKHRQVMMLGEVRPTKELAGADGTFGRIACIQIPDITEGEGL